MGVGVGGAPQLLWVGVGGAPQLLYSSSVFIMKLFVMCCKDARVRDSRSYMNM